MDIRIKALLPMALAAATLGGCTGAYGLSTGYGVADPYYDGYGYGYGDNLGYGYGSGGFGSGWYNDFYYPGTGVYVIDRGGNRHRWNDGQRRYWEGRRNQGRPNVGRPGDGRPGYGNPGGGRPGYGRPDRGERPDMVQPGANRPDRGQGRPGGWNGSRDGQDGRTAMPNRGPDRMQGQRPDGQPRIGQGGRGNGGPRYGGGRGNGGARGAAPRTVPQQ